MWNKIAEKAAHAGQPERITWRVAEFQVTDLDRSVAFWTGALGLTVRDHDSNTATLGTQKETLFILHAGASIPASPRHLGMYHTCLGLTDQNEFSRLLARLIERGIPFSPVDHLMTKSLYLHDPDGLEIEIGYETPERFARFEDKPPQGFVMYTTEGKPHSGRDPLDLKAELSHAQSADLDAPLSNNAFLSHIHFRVDQLDTASTWYEGIGFAKNLNLATMGIADMGAGAAYTHRIAMNIWAGPNLKPAPSNMARLLRYELHAHDPAVIANAKGLLPSDVGLTGIDPTGTEVSLIPAF